MDKVINDSNVTERQCKGCGALFTKTHAAKVWCGKPCYRRHYKRAPRVRTVNRMASVVYKCKQCGCDYHPKRKDRASFCSRECRFEHQREIASIPKRVSYTIMKVRCSNCGAWMVSVNGGRICSDECNKAVRRGYSRKQSVANHRDEAKPCHECGVTFTTEYGNKRKKYCSLVCAKRNNNRRAKARRRARKLGNNCEAVDPFAVFDRDGWTCKLCHRPTPRALRGLTVNRAPELDHVLPLSKGGPHNYANTQCLCRACNMAKGDAIIAAQ